MRNRLKFYCILLAAFLCVSTIRAGKSDSLLYLFENEKSDSLKAHLLIEIADSYLYNDHYKSLEYFNKSLEYCTKLNDTAGIVVSFTGISDFYSMVGEYKTAISYLDDALHLSKNNNELLALCHSRLAIEYKNLGDKNKSLDHYKETLYFYSQLKDSIAIGFSFHNLAYYYLIYNQLDSALIYLKESESYISPTESYFQAYINSSKSIAERLQGNFSKAISLHYKALKFFVDNKIDYEACTEESSLALTFETSQNLDSALAHYYIALEYAENLDNPSLQISNYQSIGKIFSKKEDYKNALKYALLEKAYMDTLNSKNKESAIKSIKTKYQIEQQGKLISQSEELNKHLSTQRMILAIFSVSTIILLISLFVIFRSKHKEHKRNIQLVNELNKVNSSIKKILSIIGHDLRDSIGNLKNFTHLMHYNLLDKHSIESMITKFVPMVEATHDLLENLLTWSNNHNNDFIPNLEIINTQEIVNTSVNHITHLAKNKNICIKENVENFSLTADKNMILTVLRNLVTNAIKFSDLNTCILIEVKEHNHMAEFIVHDRGRGMTTDEISKVYDEKQTFHSNGTMGERGSGLGLALCISFIEKHNGKLEIESTPGKGSSFKFSIPSHTNNKESLSNVC